MSRATLTVSGLLCLAVAAALAGCGGEQTTLPLGPGDSPAAWPGKIAFASAHSPAGIYTMNPDGTGQAHVPHTEYNDGFPSWSPDRTQLVCLSVSGAIYRINADGSGRARLTKNCYDGAPKWSPAGDKIVFPRHEGGWQVWVMKTDGTSQKRLSNLVWDDHDPSWSPDGKKIVFSRNTFVGWPLYVMNADGTSVVQVTAGTLNVEDTSPAWAPNGGKIAYLHYRLQNGSTGLYTIKPNGAGIKELRTPTSAYGSPTWSPDSAKIAFAQPPAALKKDDIYVASATNGAILKRLTTDPASDNEACWSKS